MTTEEKNILADAYYFLRDHDSPPALGTDACIAFWEKTAADMNALVGTKWKNHPLAMSIGIALYSYLEKKSKAKDGGEA